MTPRHPLGRPFVVALAAQGVIASSAATSPPRMTRRTSRASARRRPARRARAHDRRLPPSAHAPRRAAALSVAPARELSSRPSTASVRRWDGPEECFRMDPQSPGMSGFHPIPPRRGGPPRGWIRGVFPARRHARTCGRWSDGLRGAQPELERADRSRTRSPRPIPSAALGALGDSAVCGESRSSPAMKCRRRCGGLPRFDLRPTWVSSPIFRLDDRTFADVSDTRT